MSEFPVSAELWSLAEATLNEAFRALETGPAPFQPIIAAETEEGGRHLLQLVLVTSADPLQDAIALLARERPQSVRAVIAVDGHVDVEGRGHDAIVLAVGDRGSKSHRFAQPYRRKRLGRGIERVGNLGYFGEEAPLLP